MRFRPTPVHRIQALLRRFRDVVVNGFIGRDETLPDDICRDECAPAVFTLDMSPQGKDAQTIARVRAAFGGEIPPPAQLFAFLEREGLYVPNN